MWPGHCWARIESEDQWVIFSTLTWDLHSIVQKIFLILYIAKCCQNHQDHYKYLAISIRTTSAGCYTQTKLLCCKVCWNSTSISLWWWLPLADLPTDLEFTPTSPRWMLWYLPLMLVSTIGSLEMTLKCKICSGRTE